MISLGLIERHAKSRVTKDFDLSSLDKVQRDRRSVGCPWLFAIALSQPNQQFVNCATASIPSLVCTHCVCVCCAVLTCTLTVRHCFVSRPDRKPRFPCYPVC